MSSLCASAGIGASTWWDAMSGNKQMRGSTLAKLNLALGRFGLSYAGDKGPMETHALYKVCLVLAAFQLKTDAKAAMASDPGRKATADKEWLEAARVRRLAYWIVNQMLGLRAADVARAAGVTRSSVSGAVKEVEDDEDPAMVAARQQLEEIFA